MFLRNSINCLRHIKTLRRQTLPLSAENLDLLIYLLQALNIITFTMAPHMASVVGGVTENNSSENREASQMSNTQPSQQVERAGSVSNTNGAGQRESREEQPVSTQVQHAENQGTSTPQASQRLQSNQSFCQAQQNQEKLLASMHNVQTYLLETQSTLVSNNKTYVEEFTRELGRVEDQSNAKIQEMREEFDDKVKDRVQAELKPWQEQLKPLQEQLVKLVRAEKKRKREKIKQEKDAGKPKKVMSLYNAHVQMISKMLKEQDSKENVMEVSSRTWKEMSREDAVMRYGERRAIDLERYERENKIYLDRRSNDNVDERKPAAKPSPEELVAAAAVDHNTQLGQEGHVDLASAGIRPAVGTNPCSEVPNPRQGSIFVPGIPGTWHDAESVMNQGEIPPLATVNATHGSQEIHQNIPLPAATIQPVHTASPEDGIFPRVDSNSENLPGRSQEIGLSNDDTADPEDVAARRVQGSIASLTSNRDTDESSSARARCPTQKPTNCAVANSPSQDNEHPIDERRPAAKPSPQEYAAFALAEDNELPIDERKPAAKPSPQGYAAFALADKPQEDNSGNPFRQAPHEGTETVLNPSPPPQRASPTGVSQNLFSSDDNSAIQATVECPVGHKFIHSVKKSCYHDGYEVEAVVVKVDGNLRSCKWADPSSGRVISSKLKVSNIVGSNSSEGVSAPIRNSHGLLARSTEASQSRANNRPAVARLPTPKFRKTLLPSQYGRWQVYELDGYTDGTPLEPGHVWVERESGDVMQVKKSDVTTLPDRRVRVQVAHYSSPTSGKRSKKRGNGTGRRKSSKLRHNLLTNDSSNGHATSEVQCPVGYKFSHSVPPSSRRDGYECEAEVVAVNRESRYCRWMNTNEKEVLAWMGLKKILKK